MAEALMAEAEAETEVVQCKASGTGWSCDREAHTKGYCTTHYKQHYKGKPVSYTHLTLPTIYSV